MDARAHDRNGRGGSVVASAQVSEWVASAERDYDAVHILRRAARVPYEIVGYHCQQCAEKYLKALYVQHDRQPPYIHDLVQLLRGVADMCDTSAELVHPCERLTPFGTLVRYPGSGIEIGEEHMPIVIEAADRIRDAVRHCLGVE